VQRAWYERLLSCLPQALGSLLTLNTNGPVAKGRHRRQDDICLTHHPASPHGFADPAQIAEAQERGLFTDDAEARPQEEPSQPPKSPELMITFAAPPPERNGAPSQEAGDPKIFRRACTDGLQSGGSLEVR
jgi:hypothetical protein